MNRQEHWRNVYRTKDYTQVGWYQSSPEISLKLIEKTGIERNGSIIDVGCGASALADELIRRGFANVTLLDIAHEALELVRQRLGEKENIPRYVVGDVVSFPFPDRYDVWHDRATFHFLQEKEEQKAYVRKMYDALKPGGYAIIGTFAIDGPRSCSNLPVRQYDGERMKAVIQGCFELINVIEHTHLTPGGTEQRYCFFVLKAL